MKLIYCSSILLILVMSSFAPAMHKYYLGLTEVHINTQKQTLDVSIKLFTDDLETELNKISNKKIDLSVSSKNKPDLPADKEVEALLFNYLNKNFEITVGGKLLKLEYVGYEIENDAVWCYLEVVKFKEKGKVSILNSLLYDSFPEQSNLINVIWDGVSKSAKLSNPDKLAEFGY